MIATVILIYVIYQVMVGRVFTKSGSMPLEPGLPWYHLAIETFAAGVGIVRGLRMVREG